MTKLAEKRASAKAPRSQIGVETVKLAPRLDVLSIANPVWSRYSVSRTDGRSRKILIFELGRIRAICTGQGYAAGSYGDGDQRRRDCEGLHNVGHGVTPFLTHKQCLALTGKS